MFLSAGFLRTLWIDFRKFLSSATTESISEMVPTSWSHSVQKSSENVLVSPYKEIGIKESNGDVRTLTGSS